MNELQINKKRDSYVAKYEKAVNGCVKSAWTLAEIVYNTVNACDFKDVFGTIDGYAKTLNVSKSSISKLVKAYERKLFIEMNMTDAPALSLGQIEEFGKIDINESVDFIETKSVSSDDTTKVIREKARMFLNGDYSEEQQEQEQEHEQEQEQEQVFEQLDEIMTISYNGEIYNIIDEDTINRIMEIIL